MRQTIPLTHPRHKPPQALAAVKNKVRKYLKRERRKELPEGFDTWYFDCRVGLHEDSAEPLQVSEVIRAIDAVAQQGHESVYVEILARPGVRRRPPGAAED